MRIFNIHFPGKKGEAALNWPRRCQPKYTLVISTSVISNNRLSWRKNLVLVLTWKSKIRIQNIVKKRRNCSLGAISPLFHNFSIYISYYKGVRLHSKLKNLVVQIVFPSILQIWYVEVRISRSVFEGPFDFEITRVDCMWQLIKVTDPSVFIGWQVSQSAVS